MNNQLHEHDVLFKFVKLYIAQYLASVHNICSFQSEAIVVLTIYLIRLIRQLASSAKRIVTMQGRTDPNCLHLMLANQKLDMIDLQKLLSFMIRRKQDHVDMCSINIIERTFWKVFDNQTAVLNNYEKQCEYANIRYIRPVYHYNVEQRPLPFRCMQGYSVGTVDLAYELPPELSYKQTNEVIKSQKKNVEHLVAYTKRENQISMLGVLLDRFGKSDLKSKQSDKESWEIQRKVEKKINFDPINFL